MLEPLVILAAEDEEEDSACWFKGAKERNADILYAVIKTCKTYTGGVGYLCGGDWSLCWSVKAAVE